MFAVLHQFVDQYLVLLCYLVVLGGQLSYKAFEVTHTLLKLVLWLVGVRWKLLRLIVAIVVVHQWLVILDASLVRLNVAIVVHFLVGQSDVTTSGLILRLLLLACDAQLGRGLSPVTAYGRVCAINPVLIVHQFEFFGYRIFTSYLRKQRFSSFDETRMVEALLILSVARFVEVVHVQLAHERREVIVLEVFGKHVFSEGVRVFDDKAIALMVPKHSVVVLLVLNKKTRQIRPNFLHLLSHKFLSKS